MVSQALGEVGPTRIARRRSRALWHVLSKERAAQRWAQTNGEGACGWGGGGG